jgi:L-ascorbate metabolism protein UlaG (beta-lactamase superfamily)
MQITHFGHSCVLLDTGSARLLIDPGTWSEGFESLTGLDAVLVTHQHVDHLDPQRLPALLRGNPGARLIVDPGSAKSSAITTMRSPRLARRCRWPGHRSRCWAGTTR